MSDLFGNHIVGFPMRRLICCRRVHLYHELSPEIKHHIFCHILTTNVRTLTSIAVVLPKDIYVNVSLFIALRPPSLVSKSEKTGLIHTFSELSKIYLCTFPCRDANTVLSSGKKIYTEDGS